MSAIQINQLTVGQYLLSRLYDLGIEHIFGIPGDYILRFNQLTEQHPHIAFINTTRESGAGYAANAYGQIRGMGVACITYGVGIEILSAAAQAYVESYPLIVISGALEEEQFKRSQERHHLINKAIADYGDCTQLEIFKNVTIDQGVLNSPLTAAEIIDRLLQNCQQFQKPVYVEILRNIVDQPLPSNPQFSFQPPSTNPQLLANALQATQAMLSQSRYPLIWAGHEVSRFKLNDELLAFAEKYQIPIVSTLLGKTVIDEHHPLFIGVYQGEMSSETVLDAIEKCDFLLMAGVILHDLDTGIFTIQPIAQKPCIKANDSQVVIDSNPCPIHLADFIKGLKTIQISHSFSFPFTPRHAVLPPTFAAKSQTKITLDRVFECLQTHLTTDHIIVSDIGDSLFASADLVLSQNSFRGNSYFASIGTGTPEAIGAQFANLERRVVSIVGDGGFQMSGMELSAAVRYHLDLIVIVLNNHGYGTERVILEGSFNDLVNWNYASIPFVLGGGIGIKVETEEAFENAIKTAFANRGTFYLIEVDLEKDDFSRSLKKLGKSLNKMVKS